MIPNTFNLKPVVLNTLPNTDILYYIIPFTDNTIHKNYNMIPKKENMTTNIYNTVRSIHNQIPVVFDVIPIPII